MYAPLLKDVIKMIPIMEQNKAYFNYGIKNVSTRGRISIENASANYMVDESKYDSKDNDKDNEKDAIHINQVEYDESSEPSSTINALPTIPKCKKDIQLYDEKKNDELDTLSDNNTQLPSYNYSLIQSSKPKEYMVQQQMGLSNVNLQPQGYGNVLLQGGVSNVALQGGMSNVVLQNQNSKNDDLNSINSSQAINLLKSFMENQILTIHDLIKDKFNKLDKRIEKLEKDHNNNEKNNN